MIGKTLSHFKITAKLGEGGMGAVYRAEDTKLGREVAIKVLPVALTADSERRARFEREAKVLAALNHPHIAAIYEVGEGEAGASEPVHFLAMELAEGEDLSARLDRGAVPIEEALDIAVQIADALETAHECGIVHRDLKPANVILTSDGQAKVLDFGLAKAPEGAVGSVDMTHSPTLTAQTTQVGTLLGTASYMSPEQARGKVVDKRSDIFSFGSLLYEMLAGQKAFPGDDVSETLASVIKMEPERSALPADLDPRVVHLVGRCLKKNSRERLRDIGDARLELEDVLARSGDGAVLGVAPSRPQWLPWSVAAVFGIAAIGAWIGSGSDRPLVAKAMHVEISLPDGVELAVDTEHPVLALSPDGSQLVFVGEENGIRRLYVRDLAESEARALPGTEGAASPFFSPEGDWIAFLADGSLLKKTPASGGVPVAVHRVNGPGVSRGATWNTDDTVIIAGSANSGLDRGSVGGDELRPIGEWLAITDQSAPFAWPHMIPGGNVVFTDHRQGFLDDAGVALLEVGTGRIETLVHGGTNPRYSPTGHLLFARHGSLYAIRFDPERGRVVGGEQRLFEGVMTEENGAAQFAVADDGTIAYVAGTSDPREHELVWVDRQGQVELLMSGRQFLDVRLSPDGRRLLVTSPTGANFDIWLLDLERETFTRLTTHPGEDLAAVWSPDGTRVALASEIDEAAGGPGPALARMQSLNATPELLVESAGWGNWEFPSSWSPDGRWLACRFERSGESDIWLVPMDDKSEPIAFLQSPERDLAPMFSPDGRWIAYVSDISGRHEVYIRTFPDPSEIVIQISTSGGVEPVWARDGRELFYREGDKLMVVDLGDGPDPKPRVPEMLFEGRFRKTRWGAGTANYDVSLDGRRFLMVQDQDRERPTVIHLVLNWPAVL